MKVCLVAYSFYETDNRVRRYAECLAQRGDHVEAIALQRPGQPSFEILRGVHVYRIQRRVINEGGPFSYLTKLLLFLVRSAAILAKRHLQEPYQFIHVHSVPDFEVFAAIVPRLLGAKVILDIHDIVPEFYASKFRVKTDSLVFRALLFAERISIAFSHHVIIANHLWHKKLIERSVSADRCTAIINYPDLSIFSRRPPERTYEGRFVMCYPGTLNWHQGLDVAVEAMKRVRIEIPNALFLIIGDGPERPHLAQMIQENRMEDTVQLCGMVPIEKVAQMMASVDLGVVPKRSQSFGNEAFSTKIMEFMAMGVPVVASETKVDRYYFNDDILEFFPSGDAAALADKIINLARDPERRSSLRQNAIKFIEGNSWDVNKHQYFSLVDGLTGNHPAKAKPADTQFSSRS